MGAALSRREWMDFIESCDAFSLVLPIKKQPKVMLLLSDAKMLFPEEDLREVIELWRDLDQYESL